MNNREEEEHKTTTNNPKTPTKQQTQTRKQRKRKQANIKSTEIFSTVLTLTSAAPNYVTNSQHIYNIYPAAYKIFSAKKTGRSKPMGLNCAVLRG